MSARRDEQRIQELLLAVEGVITCNEINRNLVLPCPGRLRGDRQVSVPEGNRHLGAAGAHAADASARLREVDDHAVRRFQREAQDRTPPAQAR